ncbi:TetR/AcrR family transcriptional regulator [Clostridium sp.]|uniref:TetR/AcrR family transcriptional regulator n=1 Tax=Clostridium sp. TaxID=1506 RepID=UPI00260AB57F|nr:TetR/AcrR family transcriptional regulator [Clostridium sp.]
MKDRILQAVSENISIYGLKKFNLDVVSSELKISKKTIYKYFSSKDEIVEEYFKQILSIDKESILNVLKEKISLSEKFHKIIYSYHKYKLPTNVIQEVKLYYPEQWEEINKFKEFKVQAIINLLMDAKNNGEIKEVVNLSIVTLIIQKVSEELLDGEILSENNLKLNYAADQILQIILNGILN